MNSITSPFISVVIPVYGRKLVLDELYKRLAKTLESISKNFEIILVNDASPDNGWQKIRRLAKKDVRVKGINLSRNFGQHIALTAGIDHVCGEWCVLMDCDLQDIPEELPKLFNKAQEGYDIVVARRAKRNDILFTQFISWLFAITFNMLTEQDYLTEKHDSGIANYGIYSRKAINAIRQYREHDRAIGFLGSLVGFNRTVIDVQHAKRSKGKSNYNLRMKLRMAEAHILSHSTKPLRIMAKVGFCITIMTLLYAFFLVTRYLLFGSTVAGWYSIIVSLFFFFGITLFQLGVLGLYIGRIYHEVKRRPLYFIESMTFSFNSNANNN